MSILVSNFETPPNHRDCVLEVRSEVMLRKMRLAERLRPIDTLGLALAENMGFNMAFKFPPHAICTQFIRSISRLE
jgi:hypothetical protein